MAKKPSLNITTQRYKTPINDKVVTPFNESQPKRTKVTYLDHSMYEPLTKKPKSSQGHL